MPTPRGPVKIRFGYELLYSSVQVTPMVLLLRAAPSPSQRLLVSDVVRTEPFVPVAPFRDAFGNQCMRLQAPAGTLRISADGLLEDPGIVRSRAKIDIRTFSAPNACWDVSAALVAKSRKAN